MTDVYAISGLTIVISNPKRETLISDSPQRTVFGNRTLGHYMIGKHLPVAIGLDLSDMSERALRTDSTTQGDR
jgi:hypothetical protein